jgi:DNA-directed RNA polymerase specialized sigma24 family protein
VRRDRLLALMTEGVTLEEAARELGVTASQVKDRTKRDAEFGKRLSEAGRALCVAGLDSPRCGTAV